MNTKSNHLIEWLLTLLLIISILINVGWFIFRYGGHYYYMKISSSTGTSPITLPVNIPATGYQYQGLATNSKGEKSIFILIQLLLIQPHSNADKLSESHSIKGTA
ncbi:hypothetical protein IMAU70004_03248 [Lactiplantibacillus plantarum]|nr:hypothetical protein [Lactiplantibacillus plantarum]